MKTEYKSRRIELDANVEIEYDPRYRTVTVISRVDDLKVRRCMQEWTPMTQEEFELFAAQV